MLGIVSVLSAVVLPEVASAAGPGSLLDVVQGTATVNATSTATTYLTGGAVTYDGATKVAVTLSVPVDFGEAGACDGGTVGIIFRLFDGSTEVGRIIDVRYNPQSNPGVTSSEDLEQAGTEYLTPSAGSHTFHVTMVGINAGTSGCVIDVDPGNGTGDNEAPATLTVTQVSGSSGAASTLAGLSDVNVASPADGDVLTYNAASSKWVNSPDADAASGGAASSCGASTDPCSVSMTGDSQQALVDVRHLAGWQVGLTIFGLIVPMVGFLLHRGSP